MSSGENVSRLKEPSRSAGAYTVEAEKNPYQLSHLRVHCSSVSPSPAGVIERDRLDLPPPLTPGGQEM